MILRLMLALLIAACSLPARAEPLLVSNVNGYTLDGEGRLHRFEALLLESGRVIDAGSAATACSSVAAGASMTFNFN